MKLSQQTLTILKNFAGINDSIFIEKGEIIRTVSPLMNVLAEAKLDEKFPTSFGIYDLNKFLSVISMFSEIPELDFDDKNVYIKGNQGKSKISYRFCDESIVTKAPNKKIKMTSEYEFVLKAKDLAWILKASSVLSTSHISFDSDGNKLKLVTFDPQDDSCDTEEYDTGETCDVDMKMIFKTEHMKFIPGTYKVEFSPEGISKFESQDISLTYWISTEAGSSLSKG